MFDVKTMVLGCAAYLKENPHEILRAARSAVKLRFGLPIDAIQWVIGQLKSDGGPRDIELSPCPPGLRVAATVEEMGTLIRGTAVVTVESVEISAAQLLVAVRLSDVSLGLLDETTTTPLAALIRSGALDLTRVANLVAHLPTRPSILVDASDDRLVLDFMQLPRLATDERLRRVVGIIAQLLKIETVESDMTHLDVALKALPQGLRTLFEPRPS